MSRLFRLYMVLLAMLWLPLAQGGQDFGSRHYKINSSQSAGREMASIPVADLPAEGRAVLKAIKQGGPFEYDRDGVVFGNFERALPKQPRGYYHEYTVKTPGARNRGARRIISGTTDEYYYTADHYKTFARIKE